MQEKYERLTDSQWKVIAEFLPVQRKRKLNLRNIVDVILCLDPAYWFYSAAQQFSFNKIVAVSPNGIKKHPMQDNPF